MHVNEETIDITRLHGGLEQAVALAVSERREADLGAEVVHVERLADTERIRWVGVGRWWVDGGKGWAAARVWMGGRCGGAEGRRRRSGGGWAVGWRRVYGAGSALACLTSYPTAFMRLARWAPARVRGAAAADWRTVWRQFAAGNFGGGRARARARHSAGSAGAEGSSAAGGRPGGRREEGLRPPHAPPTPPMRRNNHRAPIITLRRLPMWSGAFGLEEVCSMITCSRTDEGRGCPGGGKGASGPARHPGCWEAEERLSLASPPGGGRRSEARSRPAPRGARPALLAARGEEWQGGGFSGGEAVAAGGSSPLSHF